MSECTYYEVLQVRNDADKEVIQASYRRLSKKFHPDNTETGDAKKFQKLVDAFEVLSNDADRYVYDKELIHSFASNHTVEKQPLDLNSKKKHSSIFSKCVDIFISIIKIFIRTPLMIIFFLWNFIKMFLALSITWVIGKSLFIFFSWIYFEIRSSMQNSKPWLPQYIEKSHQLEHFLFPKYPINYNWEWILIIVLALILALVATKDQRSYSFNFL